MADKLSTTSDVPATVPNAAPTALATLKCGGMISCETPFNDSFLSTKTLPPPTRRTGNIFPLYLYLKNTLQNLASLLRIFLKSKWFSEFKIESFFRTFI